MPALAPGQARLIAARRSGAPKFRRVRRGALGLFFLFVAAAADLTVASCARTDPRALAASAERADGTHLYGWLVEHDPSSLVAWHVSPDRLRALAPDARTIAVAGARPCAEATRMHAALVLIASDRTPAGRRDREVALDCGVALFRDGGGLVIAPR
ncbi:MAG: hypothetical protein NVS3B17_16170 [Vulcanimicrobiaceae bacterium]